MTQAIHLPTSIYEYMDDNFFQWICDEVVNFGIETEIYLDYSQSYLSLDEC